MLTGEQETKDNFKYLTKHGVRAMGSIFLHSQEHIEELVNNVPENVLTGFHLKDIFDSTKKIADIRRKVYDAVLFNKRFPKTLEITNSAATESKDEKKKKNIEFDLNKFF